MKRAKKIKEIIHHLLPSSQTLAGPSPSSIFVVAIAISLSLTMNLNHRAIYMSSSPCTNKRRESLIFLHRTPLHTVARGLRSPFDGEAFVPSSHRASQHLNESSCSSQSTSSLPNRA